MRSVVLSRISFIRTDEHVRWLEVAMENAAVMRELHGFGDGFEIGSGFLRGQRLVLNEPREIRPIHVIHHHEVLAFM